MTTTEMISLFAVLTALGALWWQIRQNTRQARMQTFLAYTQRYQDIMASLPISIEYDDFSLDTLEAEEKESALRWIRAYYDLCSEEFYLKEQHLVDAAVWHLWESGMTDSLRKPAFRQAWKIIQANEYYAREFAHHVERIQGADMGSA